MNAIKKIGYALTVTGMAVFAASLFNSSQTWVEMIRNGGVVTFSIGMALILSALSFSLGMEREGEKIRKDRFKAISKTPLSSSVFAYSQQDDDNAA